MGPTFEWLMVTELERFYERGDQGTNYAMARYLCYFLQEQGLLRQFYKELRRNRADDPGGYETLQKILGRTDMKAFQKEWEQWALELRR